MMGKLFLVLNALLFVGCTTTQTPTENGKWKVISNSNPGAKNQEVVDSNFVPSGTELIFTANKRFTEKDNNLNIELSPMKRCNLSTGFDKSKQSDLTPNTILTVVAYRGKKSELLLSDSSYHQYFISCVSKSEQKRKTSSVKSKKSVFWKKSVVEIADIQRMAPLLKVKFIPQMP